MNRTVLAMGLIPVLMFGGEKKGGNIIRSGESDMPTINTRVRNSTLVLLPDGEEISEVICGDKDLWVIEGKERTIFVKPSKEGTSTNVHVTSKSKATYSFIVREVSRMLNAKPDLKVLLAASPDDITKLREERDMLAKALIEKEKEAASSGTAKKKEDDSALVVPFGEGGKQPKAEIKPLPPPVETPLAAASKPIVRAEAVVPVAPPPPAKPNLPSEPAKLELQTDVPVPKVESKFGTTVLGRRPQEGLIRKTGRFLGRLFRKVNEAIRLY